MFQSLYRRFGDTSQATRPSGAFREWPATYISGICLDTEHWQLEVNGLVAESRRFSLADIKALPRESQNRRIVSAEGWTYRGRWEGVLLNHLLERVRPLPTANVIKQTNLMGQTEWLPLRAAVENRALLCFAENERPLEPLYGGPVRLLLFNRYSYKGLSQLASLEFVHVENLEDLPPGFWQQRGYTAEGNIEPGNYYAFDLREFRPISFPGEISGY